MGIDVMKNIVNLENCKEQSAEMLQPLKNGYMEPHMSEKQLNRLKLRMEEAKRDNRREKGRHGRARLAAAAAALVLAFVALPNMSPAIAHAMEQMPVIGQLVKVVIFRDYVYEDEQHKADVKVPELMADDKLQSGQGKEELGKTTEEINREIQEITSKLVDEFKTHMQDELGYKELIVESQMLASTPELFTLRLVCYEGEASGYEWNYYYTIDLMSGERLHLKDIFVEGADYITLISQNIKEQMQSRMEADEDAFYWLDSDIEDLNFNAITEETSFYINEINNVVICFNEGDVAPMYMGVVEFEIPAEILQDIRK